MKDPAHINTVCQYALIAELFERGRRHPAYTQGKDNESLQKDLLAKKGKWDRLKDLHSQNGIGSLWYFMSESQPELQFLVKELSQYCAAPTQEHWTTTVKHIMRFSRA